jgi:hypothetical protein
MCVRVRVCVDYFLKERETNLVRNLQIEFTNELFFSPDPAAGRPMRLSLAFRLSPSTQCPADWLVGRRNKIKQDLTTKCFLLFVCFKFY